ncbi:UvrD-helicase domain-containing protein [Aeromicrobium fastidiosum]|uniref:nuclease-related domain-containing DEAD/DEAH box helicase n=1 Tax=Aeromicrobium fastidiosum TaxID=52699 RepID=UPI00202383CB|nr:3'-5' exonuclease [Aeromicrobium fastidiosum]MCL8250605.1 UvrD-helicase domain-containing protein [Aeromicrobium fastidiosum]
MVAGASARFNGDRLVAEADALFELRELKMKEARNYLTAALSESSTAALIRPLMDHGWVVLEDRRWPGSKRANIDFILVGPGGIVLLDAKHWAELGLFKGSLFRGQECVDDEVTGYCHLIDVIAETVASTGLAVSAISPVWVFTDRDLIEASGPLTILGDRNVVQWLLRLPVRLTSEQVLSIADLIGAACPEVEIGLPLPSLSRRRPKPRHLAAATERPPTQDALPGVGDLTAALLDSALAKPIESWMTFLHPEQNQLICKQVNGPSRLRGPAGTGKSVVGLHRAVYLAQRSRDPVLFVSFVKTLPIVLSSLARRLSASASQNIEFIGVHKLARQCLEKAGMTSSVSADKADAAFGRAWITSGAAGHLRGLNENANYWKDEINYVLKGRGITEFGQYENLTRVGRKTPMRLEDRKFMWDLFATYEAELELHGVRDFNDLILDARLAVQRYPDLFRYGGVIVDEVQDLNLISLKFLHELAGQATHQFLIMGDGQQSVYPGGFTLSEAGINVTGRSTVLRLNYRNTREIVAEARRLVDGDVFNDLDDEAQAPVADELPSRVGAVPTSVIASGRVDLHNRLVEALRLTHGAGTAWGDMAVLARRRADVDALRAVMHRASIPCRDLTDYDGVASDQVKVGTVKRAKGLEFKVVFVPGLSHQPPRRFRAETDSAYAERCEIERREWYVAMTRARDTLWLGYLD